MPSPSRARSRRRSRRGAAARAWLRALMAELERLANHLGDIGAICNDASFALMHAHCGMLREHVLRAADACFGHRLMMDRVVPGGVAVDLDGRRHRGRSATLLRRDQPPFPELVELYDNTASLQDRTVATGILSAELARQFAAGGFIGRASGRALRRAQDAWLRALRRAWLRGAGARRRRRQCARLDPHPRGRASLRADRADPATPACGATAASRRSGARRGRRAGAGREVSAAISWPGCASTMTGNIARCHLRDPSWFQWPLLEAAIEGNIVADFPLCNKSFNCSYSGHDL